MAIESLVALGLVVVFLGGIAWYSTKHRAEDHKEHHRKHSG